MNRFYSMLLLVCALLVQACSTSGALVSARVQFQQGSAVAALQTLEEASVSRRDTLLLLMDKALVAQAAEEYEQSIVAFEEAYQLIDELDYVSARDQASSLLTNDWAIRYSGEYSERLWVHTFQMINYLLINQPGSAAVEARRAVKLFDTHKDVLDGDFFTRYLMAISFEAAGQFDSASVEYRKLAALLSKPISAISSSGNRELILIVANGFIAPKLPGDIAVDINARIAFPFYPVVNPTAPDITVSTNGTALEHSRIDTQLLSIARLALAKRGTRVAARQAVRLASKYAIAKNLEAQDELAGQIAQIVFFAIEQADTRSWETLPAHLSLMRVSVPDNVTSVQVQVKTFDRFLTGFQDRTVTVNLNNNSKQFKLLRIGINTSDCEESPPISPVPCHPG